MEDRKTVTVEEGARILGLSRGAAYDAVKRGEIPSLRIGRRILIPKAALERMLSGNVKSRTSDEADNLGAPAK